MLNRDNEDIGRVARTVGSAHNVYSQESLNSDTVEQQANRSSVNCSSSRKRPLEDDLKPDNSAKHDHRKIWKPESVDCLSDTAKCEGTGKEWEKVGPQSTLEAEIDAALQGRPKYLPSTNRTSQRIGVFGGITEAETSKSSAGKSQSKSRVRTQPLIPPTNLLKRSVSHLVTEGKSSTSGRHSLVQMIGGALSVSDGRLAAVSNIPVHRSQSKPTNVVAGDCKPKPFKIPSANQTTCSCGETEGLYQLPCSHVLCRTCISNQQPEHPEIECSVCRKCCKRSEVAKYHEKSIFS